jgi:hypothetical protein
MDHDTGFAPNVEYDLCTLSGCKKTTIEKWAEKGSWVIGIGGNNTGKANKLIYIMKVDENLSYEEFRKRYPIKSKYLTSKAAGTNVLVSMEFYYFGNRAIDLPPDLKHIIIDRQGCKRILDKVVYRLIEHIKSKGFRPGKIGNPNNH